MVLDFKSDDSTHVLTFEDDGKVAYAYLKKTGEIVSDVWLYNRCVTPDFPEWSDKSNIPFANSKEYTNDAGRIGKDVRPEDVLVDWESDEKGPVAYIYLFEDLLAVLGVGDKPGYARHAIKDSPLARVMVIESAEK